MDLAEENYQGKQKTNDPAQMLNSKRLLSRVLMTTGQTTLMKWTNYGSQSIAGLWSIESVSWYHDGYEMFERMVADIEADVAIVLESEIRQNIGGN